MLDSNKSLSTINFDIDKIQEQIDSNDRLIKPAYESNYTSVSSTNHLVLDDLTVFNQDYDLSNEIGVNSNSSLLDMTKLRSSSQTVSHHELKIIKENQRLLKINKMLQDKIKKLEVHRKGMYMKNDFRSNQTQKLNLELFQLKEKYDDLNKQMNSVENENLELRVELRKLREHNQETIEKYEHMKDVFQPTVETEVKGIKDRLMSRIEQLELDNKVLKGESEYNRQMYELTQNSTEIKNVVDKLSIMFLSKRYELDFLTTEQQKLVKSLFGDHMAKIYHDKLEKVKMEYKESLNKQKEEISKFLEMSLNLLNQLLNMNDYKNNERLLKMKIY